MPPWRLISDKPEKVLNKNFITGFIANVSLFTDSQLVTKLLKLANRVEKFPQHFSTSPCAKIINECLVWCFINQRKINFQSPEFFMSSTRRSQSCPSNANHIEDISYAGNRNSDNILGFNVLMVILTAIFQCETKSREGKKTVEMYFYFWRCETRFMSPSNRWYPKKKN